MPKFQITETIHSEKVLTVRLGQAGVANRYSDKDAGKAVKLTGESRYELCEAGEPIEGVIISVNTGSVDDFSIGGIVCKGYKEVSFGTAVAVGEYVVAGAQAVKGVAEAGPLKVNKAADQDGAGPFKARVVSLGAAGTGAAGTVGVIEIL